MPDRPPPPLVPEGPHYRELDWNGHALYDCEDCPFDTLDPDIMRQHQDKYHGRAVALMAARLARHINTANVSGANGGTGDGSAAQMKDLP